MLIAAVITGLLLVAAGLHAAVGVTKWRRSRVPGSGLGPLEVYSSRWAASDADIADAYELFVEQLGDEEEVSLDNMRLLHARNPETLRLIERQRGSQSQLMGMVLLAPLTSKGEDRIRRHKMRDSFDTNINRDAANDWDVDAAYVGGVAGSSERGRGHALGFCEAFFQQHGIQRAYARPISKDGKRVMRRRGFRPLASPSRFWAWDRSEVAPK